MKGFKEFLTLRNQYITAFWLTLVVSIGLILGGAMTPPYAEIPGSLLEGVGLLFLWPALMFAAKALEDGKTATIQHGQTTVKIGKDADEEELNPDEEPETL